MWKIAATYLTATTAVTSALPTQLRGLEAVSQADATIPHNLIFSPSDTGVGSSNSEKKVIRYRENVMKIVDSYRKIWGEPQAKVYVLDDETCLRSIRNVEPGFEDIFIDETDILRKSDICRLAALYEHGGYFFEPDLQVVGKFQPEIGTEFAAVVGCDGKCVNPEFLASTPKQSVVKSAINVLLSQHQKGVDNDRPIQNALAEALDLKSTKKKENVVLLERLKLDHVLHPYDYVHKFYPKVARQNGHGNCNTIIHDPTKEAVYFFEHFVGTNECVDGLIPHNIWFSFKTNILETKMPEAHYKNVMNTVEEYRKLWGEPDAPVHFLDDEDCRKVIEEAFPALLPYFNAESIGAYKGDICRNAALYLHGGYYFDVDMLVVDKVVPRRRSTFVSTLSCGGGCFFQAFFATTAKHPIVEGSLKKMLEIYENGMDTIMIGPITMANAYHEMQWPNREEDVELYEEMRLDVEGPDFEHYPNVPRQQSDGDNNCNFVVHNPERKVIYFFARFVGYGGCQPPKEKQSKS